MAQARWRRPSPQPRLLRASHLLNAPVVTRRGQGVARVKDIVIDTQQGRLSHAIVAVWRWSGAPERLSPLPWRMVDWDPDRRRLLTDLPSLRLAAAPSFPPAGWPDSQTRPWQDEIREYYGLDEEETGVAGWATPEESTGAAETPTGRLAAGRQQVPEMPEETLAPDEEEAEEERLRRAA